MTPQALPFQAGNQGSTLTTTLGSLALASGQPAPQTSGAADADSAQGAILTDSESDSEYVGLILS